MSSQVGFDNNGKLQVIELDFIGDLGSSGNEDAVGLGTSYFTNVYSCPNLLLKSVTAFTNTPSNTFMRTPGKIQCLYLFTDANIVL